MLSAPRSTRLILAAAAVSVAAAAPAPAEAATNSCRANSTASGNQVLHATKQSVVFHSARLKQDVACTYKDRRIVKLQRFVCCQMERYALGARYLGYTFRLDAADNEYDEVGVIDLKTGKRLTYGGDSRIRTISTGAYVRALYVTPKGTVAWLHEYPSFDPTDPTSGDIWVQSAVPGGNPTTHDMGEKGTIDTTSLALSSGGKTLFWTNAGSARSAALN